MDAFNQAKKGTETGTGAIIPIVCGFTPSHVRLMNIDGNVSLDWTDDMAAGGGYKIDGGSVDNGYKVGSEYITTGGITVMTDSDGTRGFYIGADTDINVVGEEIIWIAYGD
jgi:hypothetical protein